MDADEQAIRDVVSRWMSASRAGDIATVSSLMTDDVVFMVPGKEPFGKEAFIAGSKQMQGISIDGISDIKEIVILGDWAWMRGHLRVTITPPNGQSMIRSGYVLTILKKKSDGNWAITRDANMLTPETV